MAKKDMNLDNMKAREQELNSYYESKGKLANKDIMSLTKELSINKQINLSNKEIEKTLRAINEQRVKGVKSQEKLKVQQELEKKLLQEKLGLNNSMMKVYNSLDSYQGKLNSHLNKTHSLFKGMSGINLKEIFTDPLGSMDKFSGALINKVVNVGKSGLEGMGVTIKGMKGAFNDVKHAGTIFSMQLGEDTNKIKGNLGGVGQMLLGVNNSFRSFTGGAKNGISQLGKAFGGLKGGVGTVADGFSNLRGIFGNVKGAFGSFAGGMKGGLTSLAGGVKGLAGTMVASMGSAMLTLGTVIAPIIAIQVAVAGLVKMFDLMMKFNFGGIASEFGAAVAQIKQIWAVFEISIMDTLEPLEPMFSAIFGGAADLIVSVFGMVTGVFNEFFQGFVDSFGNVEESTGSFKDMFENLKPVFASVTESLKPIFAIIGRITGILMQILVPVIKLLGAIMVPLFKVVELSLMPVYWSFEQIAKVILWIVDYLALLEEPILKLGELMDTYLLEPARKLINYLKELISLIPFMGDKFNEEKSLAEEQTSKVDKMIQKEGNEDSGVVQSVISPGDVKKVNYSYNINNNVKDRETGMMMANSQTDQIVEWMGYAQQRGA